MGTIADVVEAHLLQSQRAATVVSDEQAKTEIKSGDEKLDDFFSTIGAHEYEYKNKEHGDGVYVSPMAQELEKTTIGSSAVVEDADGLKKVDYGRLVGASLSGLAMHHEDIKEIKRSIKALERALPKARKNK